MGSSGQGEPAVPGQDCHCPEGSDAIKASPIYPTLCPIRSFPNFIPFKDHALGSRFAAGVFKLF